MTSASFFAAVTFHFSSTTLSSAGRVSQTLLSTLDAILGSTESSRAIAAIITLIRRELRETGARENKITVGDLLVGSVGFALLQRWGRKTTARQIHENGGDEMIWDVVILDNGARADVVGTRQLEHPSYHHYGAGSQSPEAASFMSPGSDERMFDAVQRRPSIVDALDSPNQQQASDEEIRSYITKQLPQGCHASIRTDWMTARTITVDIYDDDSAEIAAPPGTKMIEERFHHDHDYANGHALDIHQLPKHTVVFRTARNTSHKADIPSSESSGAVIDCVPAPDEHLSESGNLSSARLNKHIERLDSEAIRSPVKRIKGNDEASHLSSEVTNEAQARTQNASRALHKQTTGSASAENEASGKGSFSRLAQKVNPRDKSDGKRPSMRKPLKSSMSTPATASLPSGVSRKQAPPNKALSQARTKPTSSDRVPKLDLPSRRTAPSPAANRGLPRLPLQNSTWDIPPGSSGVDRRHSRSSSSMSLTRSEANVTVSMNNDRPGLSHKRSKSYSSSIYSLATAGSDTSLILAHRTPKSAYEDVETIQSLNRDGHVQGIFPRKHFVQNIRRFCRFASASYGSNALKVMGVPKIPKALLAQESDTHEHSAFSDHAGLPTSTILLSSFVDPAGGSNSAGETETGFPLVHYLCIDHESKAVVLTLRGTWGFEDILTDMTCDYDDLEWQGRHWKVHKGMHASAKRLLEGGGARVMITIRAALEEFVDYGVVLCGHSLGGGVAALLATMISEPGDRATGTSFVTASYQSATRHTLPTACPGDDSREEYFLPPGRPIHVYAYGPPSVMSPFLRRATRGLITTIVNGQDVVPSLSLGILHDMHSVAAAFKNDASGAKSHVRHRVWEGFRASIINKFYVNETPMPIHAGDGVGEDAWAWTALKMLRDEMRAPKLMPPGEVFVADTMRVLQRDAFTADAGDDGYPRLGRPATRVQLKFIRDVEALFGEIRFGSGMLSDHNPVRYEASLAALARGILDE